jgi:hypothetical protein
MFMRKSICILCLLLFGGCLAARADSVVEATINGVYHNGDDTFSSTFSFDPAQVFYYTQPFYYGDFLYPLLTTPDFPANNFDTVDFFGDSFAFTVFQPNFLYEFEIDFYPGTCQDIPPVAGTGVVPTFQSMTCDQVRSVYDGVGLPPFEVVEAVDSVVFTVEGGATTPEPSSLILLGTGLAGLFHIGVRRARTARRAA